MVISPTSIDIVKLDVNDIQDRCWSFCEASGLLNQRVIAKRGVSHGCAV